MHVQQSPQQDSSSPWQQSSAHIPLTSFLVEIARLVWLGRSDKGTTKAADQLTGLLFPELLNPAWQRVTQLLQAVATGYFEGEVLKPCLTKELLVFAVG